MADFTANTVQLKQISGNFDSISSKIQNADNDCRDALNSLRRAVSAKIGDAKSVKSSIAACKREATKLNSTLIVSANSYFLTENRIKHRNYNSVGAITSGITGTVLDGILDPIIVTDAYLENVKKAATTSIGLTEITVEGDLDYLHYKDDKANKIVEKDKVHWKQENEDVKKYDKVSTIFEAKMDASNEVNVVHAKGSGSNEFAEGSYDVKVLNAEYHSKLSGGLYVYQKDENGNMIKKLAPGFEAAIGASVSAFKGSAEGRIGLGKNHDLLGINGNAEVTALSAGAELSASVSLFSDNPQLAVKAEIEAIAVEAKGSAGVSVLGTDLNVTGGVNIGVGAHADIGYTDGKLKVDVGASLGIGVDLGFEVDVSGTVDYAVDIAGDVAKSAEKAVDAVSTGVSSFFKSLW